MIVYFRIQTLTDDINKGNNELSNILQTIDQIKTKKTFVISPIIYLNKKYIWFSSSYNGRKNLFEQEQQADSLQMKLAWNEELKNDLQEVFDDFGIVDDNSSFQEIPTGVR